MTRELSLPCPACGFLTVEGAYGSYNICQVCDWEDDQLQLANPASGGGANVESLIEAQSSALVRYPQELDSANGVHRDPSWRPLNQREKDAAWKDRAEQPWRNPGVVELADCYWIRTPSV